MKLEIDCNNPSKIEFEILMGLIEDGSTENILMFKNDEQFKSSLFAKFLRYIRSINWKKLEIPYSEYINYTNNLDKDFQFMREKKPYLMVIYLTLQKNKNLLNEKDI